jgi:hypothetical protein
MLPHWWLGLGFQVGKLIEKDFLQIDEADWGFVVCDAARCCR